MRFHRHSRNDTRRGGFGLVEVLISIGLLAAIFVASITYFSGSRSAVKKLNSKTDCNTITNSIVNRIKNFDNSLTVRNWMVTANTNFGQLMPNRDPFCNNVNGRTAVCDPFPMVTVNNQGYLDLTDLRTYLNIRGAYTWAQSVYNNNGAAICNSVGNNQFGGIQLSPQQLDALLPGEGAVSDAIDHYTLYIRERDLACGAASNNRSSRFTIAVTAYFQTQNTPAGQFEACHSTIGVAAMSDSTIPDVQVSRVYNGFNVDVPNGYCSDRRLFGAGASNLYQTMNFDFTLPETGSLLIARKEAPWDPQSGNYFNAPDTQLPAGVGSIVPAPGSISYNAPIQGTLTFSGMQDRGALPNLQTPTQDAMYSFRFASVDTAANVSSVTPLRSFMVHSPSCPTDPSLYCPNAVDAIDNDPACPGGCTGPPDPDCNDCWDTNNDKNIQPFDNCMNGLCPEGTRPPVCDLTIAPFVCQGTNYGDDCGLDRCPGTRPPYCPPGPYNTIPCGDNVPGECVASCGLGTGINTTGLNPMDYDCDCVITDACNNDTQLRGVGGNNGRITCPPPPPANLGQHNPGCDCTGIDYTTIACGTAVDDICAIPTDVTSESCGLGQMGCSPCAPNPPVAPSGCTEAPTSGQLDCADHDYWGDTTCPGPMIVAYPIPTCARYTLTVTPSGHRHGGSALRYRVIYTGGSINVSRSDGAIGPSTPSHPGNPLFPLGALPGLPVQTRVIMRSPGVPIWIRTQIYDSHDAAMRLQWTITPSTP